MGKVIAIDGPSGAGKSTLAKELARRLGFSYLDTGALYRAVALVLREKGIEPDDADEKIMNVLKSVSVSFKDGKVFLKEKAEAAPHIPPLPRGEDRGAGRDVSEEIRSVEIGHYSSVFSARKVVRDFLLGIQRESAGGADVVAEGRDMTTVVFPDAWKKFFIDASVNERAKRRYLQLKEKGYGITESDAKKDVVERDQRDSSRDIAPLKKADNAFYIDSSTMAVGEILEYMLKIIRSGN